MHEPKSHENLFEASIEYLILKQHIFHDFYSILFFKIVSFLYIEGNETQAYKGQVINNGYPTCWIGNPMVGVQWEKRSYHWVTP